MRTPYLTKCENTITTLRRATYDALCRSREGYANMPAGPGYAPARIIVLLIDIERDARRARGDLTPAI